jgi:hypothetical protein
MVVFVIVLVLVIDPWLSAKHLLMPPSLSFVLRVTPFTTPKLDNEHETTRGLKPYSGLWIIPFLCCLEGARTER